MKRLLSSLLFITFVVLIATNCKKDDVSDANENPKVQDTIKYEVVNIQTDYGDILIWLYDETPLHKQNFDSLVNVGFFDSLIFHRVVKDFVIQGGDPQGTGMGGPGYTIPAEFNDNLTHVEGAVGSARDNNPEKRSSGSQFYIVENPEGTHFPDGEYTVFGITIGGMKTVHDIADVDLAGSTPVKDVVMNKVEIKKYSAEKLLVDYNFTVPEKQ